MHIKRDLFHQTQYWEEQEFIYKPKVDLDGTDVPKPYDTKHIIRAK